ncbi:MAG TPA: glycosyltransferase [Candidatus Baltobacteraceae bacterium]
MRLFLGVPSAGAPAQPFVESLSRIVLPDAVQAFERGIVTGNFVPAQRDLLVERALEWGADAIAMCDDDMILPPDALANLCDALARNPSAAIAGALYYSRDGLRPLVVDGWNAADTRQGWIPAFDDRTPVAVDGVGFGCVVIRAEAIRSFDRPFFATQIYMEKADGRVRVCNEDYLFCARVRRNGHAVLLHPGVRCKHFDRGRNAAAPPQWESAQSSGRRRVLVLKNDRYELVPLEEAGDIAAKAERQVPADVTYVETD